MTTSGNESLIINLGNFQTLSMAVDNIRSNTNISAPCTKKHYPVFSVVTYDYSQNDSSFEFNKRSQCPYEDNTARNFISQLKNSETLLDFQNKTGDFDYKFNSVYILYIFLRNILDSYNDFPFMRHIFTFFENDPKFIATIQQCAIKNNMNFKFVYSYDSIPYCYVDKFPQENDFPYYGVFIDIGATSFHAFISEYRSRVDIRLVKLVKKENIDGNKFTEILYDVVYNLLKETLADNQSMLDTLEMIDKKQNKQKYQQFIDAINSLKESVNPDYDTIFESINFEFPRTRVPAAKILDHPQWKEFEKNTNAALEELFNGIQIEGKKFKCFEILGQTGISEYVRRIYQNFAKNKVEMDLTIYLNPTAAAIEGVSGMIFNNEIDNFIHDKIECVDYSIEHFLKKADDYNQRQHYINAIQYCSDVSDFCKNLQRIDKSFKIKPCEEIEDICDDIGDDTPPDDLKRYYDQLIEYNEGEIMRVVQAAFDKIGIKIEPKITIDPNVKIEEFEAIIKAISTGLATSVKETITPEFLRKMKSLIEHILPGRVYSFARRTDKIQKSSYKEFTK